MAPVRTQGLTKLFGKLKALNDVSLEFRAGECTALVGPNGAGKSTLFKLCLGLIDASAGQISIFGHSPGDNKFDNAKRQIGFLPEQALFQPSLTGREMLRFYARLKGADIKTNDHLLARVRLEEAADRRISTYSKGMRQRLGLAQALIGKPTLLILDEPMSGLDPKARQNFFAIINEEKQRGAAIVLSSHILTELEARTDRVAILSQGRLKAVGPIEHLRAELGLHPKIRLKASPAQMEKLASVLAGRFEAETFLNGVAVLDCAPDQKLNLLRELMTGDLGFENVDIIEPSLEQVFAAHTEDGGSP